MTFRDEYKKELSKVCFSENFEGNTVDLLWQAAERKDVYFMNSKGKFIKIVVLAAAMIIVLSVSVLAVISLTPADVAEHLGNKDIVVLFENSDFEPETVKGEKYSVTFMGTAQGESICEINGITTERDRTYAVFAIYCNDGTALDILDGNPIHIIPVANGERIDAFTSYGMSASCFVKDGVLYALYDYTDLEAFGDIDISLMAFESLSLPSVALTTSENGEIAFADGYSGFKGEFSLK